MQDADLAAVASYMAATRGPQNVMRAKIPRKRGGGGGGINGLAFLKVACSSCWPCTKIYDLLNDGKQIVRAKTPQNSENMDHIRVTHPRCMVKQGQTPLPNPTWFSMSSPTHEIDLHMLAFPWIPSSPFGNAIRKVHIKVPYCSAGVRLGALVKIFDSQLEVGAPQQQMQWHHDKIPQQPLAPHLCGHFNHQISRR